MSLDIQSFVLKRNDADGGLYFGAKCYKLAGANDGVHLIFAHSVGTHKETWEPLIESLFHIQVESGKSIIAAAWSVDAPNHGESGAINECSPRPSGGYKMTRQLIAAAHVWARCIQVLLASDLLKGQRTIAIGHSVGTCAAILLTLGYADARSPYTVMVPAEPPMMSKAVFAQAFKKPSQLKAVMDLVKKKQHIWPSRPAARAWFRKRLPWKRWDDRPRSLHSMHYILAWGLRDLPTAGVPQTNGVTLACTREQETAGYDYAQDGFDSPARLASLRPVIPVHCILGIQIDLMRVVQEQPNETAAAICRAIHLSATKL
ncbi:hypothetical protein C8R44DRAFT_831759 [Mycena epipterygia]|nr:hypothetical protein C8R44DRAFT_831759 [Mycena epipterygia]